MSNLEIGSVVKLKTGNQSMTVESIEGSRVTCVWFIDSELQRGDFELVELESV